MRVVAALGLAVLLPGLASPAAAQSCEGNFAVEGVPLVTGMTYKTSQVFPKVPRARALENVAAAVSAEGFNNIQVNTSLGSVSGDQETTGSGRVQRLRVTVRNAGKGSRVDAVFVVQQGQIAPEGPTRTALCRVVGSAAD